MGCVWKRGTIYWIKYRRSGRSYYETSRSTNHDAAKKLLAKREAAIADGVPVTPQIGQLRFEEAVIDLINHHKLNKRDTKKLEARIANHLTPVFGKRRLADITPADLTSYCVARQAGGASNGTINRELALLRRAYHLAKDAGKLLHLPKFTLLREANPRAGFFERDQIDAVVRHLPDHLKPVVLFAYLTGWRSSEVLKLEWRNIGTGEIRLDPGTTKNREGRLFPFTSELRALLEGLERDGLSCPFVFQHKGQRIRGLRKPWKRACLKAGLPGRHFHDLRRSAARNFIRAGISERVAMKLTGHKTRSIFDRYNITSMGDLLEAADKLDAAVTPIVTTTGDKQATWGNVRQKTR